MYTRGYTQRFATRLSVYPQRLVDDLSGIEHGYRVQLPASAQSQNRRTGAHVECIPVCPELPPGTSGSFVSSAPLSPSFPELRPALD